MGRNFGECWRQQSTTTFTPPSRDCGNYVVTEDEERRHAARIMKVIVTILVITSLLILSGTYILRAWLTTTLTGVRLCWALSSFRAWADPEHEVVVALYSLIAVRATHYPTLLTTI